MSPNNFYHTNNGGYDSCRSSETSSETTATTTSTSLLALPSVSTTSTVNGINREERMSSQALISIIDTVLCLVSDDSFDDFYDASANMEDKEGGSTSNPSTSAGSFSHRQ